MVFTRRSRWIELHSKSAVNYPSSLFMQNANISRQTEPAHKDGEKPNRKSLFCTNCEQGQRPRQYMPCASQPVLFFHLARHPVWAIMHYIAWQIASTPG